MYSCRVIGFDRYSLQRVRLPIVGDQAGAGIDRDEEDEHALLVEETVKRLLGWRQERRARRSSCRRRAARRARGTAARRTAGEPRKRRSRRRSMMPARAMTHQARRRECPFARRSDGSPDREWACCIRYTTSPERPREHVFERRDARAEMPHLHALPRGDLEQQLRGAIAPARTRA